MHGGTPPQLWMQFTAKAKTVLWRGLLRDQVRIARLCRQVERLSWMVEYMDDCNRADQCHVGLALVTLEGAEEEWKSR